MRKIITAFIIALFLVAIFSNAALAHTRCVTLDELSQVTGGQTDGVIEQMIAGGQEPHDPAGLGIYFAKRYSPAIADCR